VLLRDEKTNFIVQPTDELRRAMQPSFPAGLAPALADLCEALCARGLALTFRRAAAAPAEVLLTVGDGRLPDLLRLPKLAAGETHCMQDPASGWVGHVAATCHHGMLEMVVYRDSVALTPQELLTARAILRTVTIALCVNS
jgi:hypothetical protein